MKQIRVAVSARVQVSTSDTDLVKGINLAREARRNRLKVIEGALTVESHLDAVILHYFFGASFNSTHRLVRLGAVVPVTVMCRCAV